MIYKLIDSIAVLLHEHLQPDAAGPAPRIVTGSVVDPSTEALPLITLYPGKLAISQKNKDVNASEPRTEELLQEFPITSTNTNAGFALARTPLPDSLKCRLIVDRGQRSEQTILLREGSDFRIDAQGKLLLQRQVAAGSLLRVSYTFIGIFTVKEFQQELLVDIYTDQMGVNERWASLTAAIILSSQTELIDRYNSSDRTEYSAGSFGTRHTIEQIQFVEGNATRLNRLFNTRFLFSVAGQWRLSKVISDGFGLIETIRSPGRTARFPVDIDIRVDEG